MTARGRLTVLVVADTSERRTLYFDTLTELDCAVRLTDDPQLVVPITTVLRIDVVVLDIGLQEMAFAVADDLASLPDRPRLVAVTSRVPTGTALENRFEAYVLEPWSPETLVDGIHAALRAHIPRSDLLIFKRDFAQASQILQRYGDIGARVDFLVDRRREEKTGNPPKPDRRGRDVSERLRKAGWIIIPGDERQ